MACRAKEVVSLFFYKICNPNRSDYKIEEHVENVNELKAEAQVKSFEAEHKRLKTSSENEETEHKWLKTLLENEEAELKRLKTLEEAELKRLETLLERERQEAERKRISENISGPSEIVNKDFYLHSDLVFVILCRLALKEKLRSSAVCKTWFEIAASVRVRDRSCWLMYLDIDRIRGTCYGFFDPVEKKKTNAIFLQGAPLGASNYMGIIYSNDGWLLMRYFAGSIYDIFFFNPFTRERINLPSYDMQPQLHFAFSCAPTQKGCVVFTIRNSFRGGKVIIGTWRPGANTWVNETFPNVFRPDHRHAKNILYADGLFYVASEIGLGVYNPSAHTWSLLPVQPYSPDTLALRWIAEYKGQIFLVDASSADTDPMVFRLNRLQSVWEKKETLDGLTIFVSNGSNVMATGLTGSMSNILYIWNGEVNERRPSRYKYTSNIPYKYSLHRRSLCEDTEGYYFEYRPTSQLDGVWIKPPHNISITDFPIIDPSDDRRTRSLR